MNRAFSLIELSIVLVILGLLTGGILSGQSLIRAAELRSVTTDIARYQSAEMAFRDKYFAIAGDMRNATSFWGNASTGTTGGECSAPESATGSAGQTCNGNGDGSVGTGSSLAAQNSEVFRHWQHLADAGLVEGSYSGVAATSSHPVWRQAVPGTNVPKGRLSNSGYTVSNGSISAAGIAPDQWTGGDAAVVKNYMMVGSAGSAGLTWGGLFKAEELWNTDTKLDDGRPGTGAVRAFTPIAVCATGTNAVSADYTLTGATNTCVGWVDMKM